MSKICRDDTLAMRIVSVNLTATLAAKDKTWYRAVMQVRNDYMDLNATYDIGCFGDVDNPDRKMKFITEEGLDERSEKVLDDFPAFDMLTWLLKTYIANPDAADKIQEITDNWVDMTLGDFIDGDYEVT